MNSKIVQRAALALVAALTVLVSAAAAPAAVVIDDFSAPFPGPLVEIGSTYPDPTLIKTTDAAILGLERDLLFDVNGAATLTTLIATVGGGNLTFNSGSPGTITTLQYDGIDGDQVVPTALVNAEGLGGINLATGATQSIYLSFLSIEGGYQPTTGISIEVHSGVTVATFQALVPDSSAPMIFYAPMASFTNPSVFTNVTSIQITINTTGAANVDFILDEIGTTTDVPEPATMGLLGLGLLGLVARRRK